MARGSTVALLLVTALALRSAPAQTQERSAGDTVRVTVSQNNDGSRTTFQTDPANRKATATTISAAGKPMGKIQYVLDESGRYQRGSVFGPDDRLRFKTRYEYDTAGRLLHEIRLTKEDALMMKIVYAYDEAGRQAGYSVYDPNGKLLGQTTPRSPAPIASPAKKKKGR